MTIKANSAPYAAVYASAARGTYDLVKAHLTLSDWTALLEGQGKVESGFDPTQLAKDVAPNGAVSYDQGIAQINSAAHPTITRAQAFDPAFAIPWQARYLGTLIEAHGVQGGLEAYNSGGATGDTGYSSAVLAAARSFGYGGTSPAGVSVSNSGYTASHSAAGLQITGPGLGSAAGALTAVAVAVIVGLVVSVIRRLAEGPPAAG